MKSYRTYLRGSLIIPVMALLFAWLPAQAGMEHEHASMHKQGEKITVTGEVVDMMCYIDHGAKGKDHQSCARKCIKGNGPVGLLTDDGDLYILIGEHEPANDRLAEYAAETITVEGKYAERNGMKMVENIHIKS